MNAGIEEPFEAIGVVAIDNVIAMLTRNESGLQSAPMYVMIGGWWPVEEIAYSLGVFQIMLNLKAISDPLAWNDWRLEIENFKNGRKGRIMGCCKMWL